MHDAQPWTPHHSYRGGTTLMAIDPIKKSQVTKLMKTYNKHSPIRTSKLYHVFVDEHTFTKEEMVRLPVLRSDQGWLKRQGYLEHTVMDLNMDSNEAYARQGNPDQAYWSITSEGKAFLKGLLV